MANFFYTPERQFKRSKTEIDSIGGTKRTNRIIVNRSMNDRIEEQFMDISFKANRSEKQKNNRKLKRK